MHDFEYHKLFLGASKNVTEYLFAEAAFIFKLNSQYFKSNLQYNL